MDTDEHGWAFGARTFLSASCTQAVRRRYEPQRAPEGPGFNRRWTQINADTGQAIGAAADLCGPEEWRNLRKLLSIA